MINYNLIPVVRVDQHHVAIVCSRKKITAPSVAQTAQVIVVVNGYLDAQSVVDFHLSIREHKNLAILQNRNR
jgi:hypothetical protein